MFSLNFVVIMHRNLLVIYVHVWQTKKKYKEEDFREFKGLSWQPCNMILKLSCAQFLLCALVLKFCACAHKRTAGNITWVLSLIF